MTRLILPAVLALAACQTPEPQPADTAACDAILASRTVLGEILLHGAGPEALPETVITDRADWVAYRAENDLPALDVDFDAESLHVVNLWSELDCEYLDDTTGELRVVRLDNDALGVVAPIARSTERCEERSMALRLVVAIPADEPGTIAEFCPIR